MTLRCCVTRPLKLTAASLAFGCVDRPERDGRTLGDLA
jgi:hypothetical protein